MIEFEKPNIKCLEVDEGSNYAKIDGVVHEFSTIQNVVEDVPEIIINLKNVRLKLDKNEEKVLRINFKGEGEVTAGDIITDGTVEVLNPDLHIATVSRRWFTIYGNDS